MGNCNRPRPSPPDPFPGDGMDGVLNDRTNFQSAKIIVMGNQKVGKTSIIKAFMEKQSQRGRPYDPTNTVQDFHKAT